MKAIGMVRKIDQLGRIVIPKEIRKSFDIKEGDPMEMFTGEQNEIILKKYVPGCHECGSVGESLYGKKVKLCKTCIKNMNL